MIRANRDNHPARVHVARISCQRVFAVYVEVNDAAAVINPVQNEFVVVVNGVFVACPRNVVGIGDNAPCSVHYDNEALVVVEILNEVLQDAEAEISLHHADCFARRVDYGGLYDDNHFAGRHACNNIRNIMPAFHSLLKVLPLVHVNKCGTVRAKNLFPVVARQSSDVVVVEDYIRVI